LLQNPIGPTDTVIDVQPGLGALFPQPVNPGEFFLVTLEDVNTPTIREIIAVYGRSGDTFTNCVRGQEQDRNGSTPQSWPAGTTLVDHRMTAETVHESFVYGFTPESGNVNALDQTIGTGFYAITSPTTGAVRTIQGSGVLSVLDGDGVAGNPTLSISPGTNGQVLTTVGGVPTWAAGGGGSSLYLYSEHPVSPSTPSATGANSIALLSGSSAEAQDSLAIGPQSLTRLQGSIAWASGRFGNSGDSQRGEYQLRAGTINAVPTAMYLDGPNGSVPLTLPDNSTWTFRATVTGHRTDASDGHLGMEFKGVVWRGSGASTTTIQGQVSRQIIARANTSWDVSITPDLSNGGLTFTVTGQSGKTIRWLAVVETVEVTN
jgi:hypothetical protein